MTAIHGQSELTVEVGSLKLSHRTWVAEITDECILGLDFLEKRECLVSLKDNVLVIGLEEVALRKLRKRDTLVCCRVTAKDTVMVLPQSEALVPGEVSGRGGVDARWAMVRNLLQSN